MVIRLPTPQIDNSSYIDSVVAERQGGINADYFAGVQAAWKVRVADYLARGGNPEQIQPWPGIAPNKEKYLNLFGNPNPASTHGAVLLQLRSLSRKLQICPACGEDGTPNTLDHYLPKDTYPELVISPANLTPMCDICQGKKSTKTLDHNNRRLFLQPYFDDFLDDQVLSLTIDQPYDAPSPPIIRPNPSLPPPLFSLVQRHLDTLEIPNRYNHFFRDQYVRLLKLAREMREIGQNIRANLIAFRTMTGLKSVNSWPHLFYCAVLANEDLLQFLEAGQLPGEL